MTSCPPGWTQQGKHLHRTFEFATFAAAMGFMVQIALFCDKTDHHPEWKNVYNKLWVDLITHDADGITDKDVALARHMNHVFEQRD